MDGLGVGSVGRSSVDTIVIPLRVLNFQQVVRITMQIVVRMNPDLNKKSIVAEDIIVIVENGGKSHLGIYFRQPRYKKKCPPSAVVLSRILRVHWW